jgi:hypothetical protein
MCKFRKILHLCVALNGSISRSRVALPSSTKPSVLSLPLPSRVAKTVWTHWDSFQRFGLEDRQAGRPPYLSFEYLDTVVAYAFAQFHAHERVPIEFRADSVPIPVSRTGMRITLIGWI